MNDSFFEEVRDASHYKTVIFGGTFDPPQAGHVDAVRQILDRGHDLVVMAITGQNPFKERQATAHAVRLEMVRVLFEAHDIPVVDTPESTGVFLSDFEYQRTYEFVDHWRTRSDTPFCWAVGKELLEDLPKWSQWEEMKLPITVLDERIALHATEIREGRATPDPALVPLIEKHQLYGYGVR